ncbi:InlB B-repeat-containing protein [Anaerosporobacter sp.]|uniref:InlB B-repeat-containing protein n=1 Tax=Anaerosporobacter sp. TaxID=1872529 RepID=UPI00286F12D4|nr:InlB B-repeat-containing protein [Anaerosporobacter sp.]
MKIKKEKIVFLIIICLLVQILNPAFITVQGKGGNKLVVKGKIKVEIKSFYSQGTKLIEQELENYPATIYYLDDNGVKKHEDIMTDNLGNYKVSLPSQSGIKKVWLEVEADNEACTVYSAYKSGKWCGEYKYKNKEVIVDLAKQSNITMDYTITGNDAGAINIARVVNNARAYMKEACGLIVSKTPKATIQWLCGQGSNSYNGTRGGNEFIFINGGNQREFSDSVICHEYGHWIYNGFREGNLKGGKHSHEKDLDVRLAYSEGLATYFGQMAINSPRYMAGGNANGKNITYSIENPGINYQGKDGKLNELYVAASFWDITDKYSSNESWDKLNDKAEQVFLCNRDVVMEADLENGIFDCTIEDFYNKYIEMHVQKNSERAYDFWRVFKENHMEFDNEPPQIINALSNKQLNIRLYDNVKVSKVEIYINGKKEYTKNNPPDNVSYTISDNKLQIGRNCIAIKAYDYAGNDVLLGMLKSDIKSNNTSKSTIGAFTQPYTVSYCDYYYEGDETTTDEPLITALSTNRIDLESFEDLESLEDPDSLIDEVDTEATIIEELANLYELVYQDSKCGTLGDEETSELRELTIADGTDFSLLLNDTLGDYEIALTDPEGNIYTNYEVTDEDIANEIAEDELLEEELYGAMGDAVIDKNQSRQNVLNLGTRGLTIFYPTAGTWTYTIRNKGTEGDYQLGVYTKLSAPIINNEEALTMLQDGTAVTVNASVAVSGSAITINANADTYAYAKPAEVHIELQDNQGEVLIEDTIKDGINETGDFLYTFNNLEDGHYNLELYSVASDGTRSFTRTSEMVVNSREPEIEMSDDCEYYIYSQEAMLDGRITNADRVEILVNGEEVPYDVGCGSCDDTFGFGCYAELKDGDNTVRITSESETGKTVVKEFVLHSIPEEEYDQEKHQPEIESVTFDGKEEPVVNKRSTVEVKLTDKNAADYKVYAVCNDTIYDFTPAGDCFTLDFNPTDYYNDNYEFVVCVISRWQFYSEKALDIEVTGVKDGIRIKNDPQTMFLNVGDTATLDISSIIDGDDCSVEVNCGTIKDGIWSFTSSEPGDFEIILRFTKGDIEKEVTFDTVYEYSKEHKLTFVTDGDELEEQEYSVCEDEEYGELPLPTKKGYEFVGWFDKEEGGNQILEDTIAKKDDSFTLYARWKSKTLTITFNPNGGSVENKSKEVTYGKKYGELPVPTWANAEFLGWYSGIDGGLKITAESIVKEEEPQTLYAQWSTRRYRVMLDSNGGELDEYTFFLYKGDKYLEMPTPTREGYTFKGWYTGSAGGTRIMPGSVVTVLGNHYLYANWEPNKYTVHFDFAGGSIKGTKEIYEQDIDFPYESAYGWMPTPQKAGCVFQGWYTEETGGTLITGSDILKVRHNQTFYAHWKYAEYQVTFVTNGNAIDVKNKKVTYMSEYGELPVPTKANYDFVGWSTANVNGTMVDSTSQVAIAGAHTLYGIWKGKTLEVSFDANGGEVIDEKKTVFYTEAYGELPVAVREGYTFAYWSYTPTGTSVASTTKVSLTSDHTLYARWNTNAYKTIFVPNGGKIVVSKTEYNDSNLYAVNFFYDNPYRTLPTPTKAGCEFTGWYTEKEGGELITVNSIVDVAEEQRLYAHWKYNEYQITFVTNGDVMDVKNKKVTYMGEYGELPVPTKANYDFVGWSTANVNGTMVDATSQVTIAGGHTLYGMWKGKTLEVSFDANGGKEIDEKKSVVYYDAYGVLPVAEREGYRFAYWSYKPTGGSNINASTRVVTAEDHTLYAYWSPNNYKTLLYPNGGKIVLSKVEYNDNNPYWFNATYDSTYMSLYTPSRAGCEFLGWYTEKEGGELVTPATIVKITEELKLYAHWKCNEFPIYFSTNGNPIDLKSKNVTYLGEYGELPVPTKENYVFLGWSSHNSKESMIDATSQVTVTGAHYIYGMWEGEKSEVSFNANGGGEINEKKTVTYSETYGVLPVPVREGYTFSWWCLGSETGTPVGSTTKVTLASDHTLYARWSAIRCRRLLDPVGGKIVVAKTEYNSTNLYYTAPDYGTPYRNLPTPTKAGYEFLGWYTEKEGGEQITVDTILRDTEERTIYAHWKPAKIKVLFYGYGGTVPISEKEVLYTGTYGDLPIANREGYSFVTWRATAPNGVVITPESEVTIATTHYLYAEWKGNTYTISFDTEGGDFLPEKREVTYGSAYGKLPVPTRTGYVFSCWVNREPGKGNVLETTIVSTAKNHTLYATWSPLLYTTTFDCTGGSYNNYSRYDGRYYFEKQYGTLNVPRKLGYDFVGWFTQEYGGKEITNTSIVDVAGERTLYAHWKPSTYTVYFNANGGTISGSNSKTVTYKESYGTLPVPTRDRYEFEGWYTQSTGGTRVTSLTQVEITGNQTLYARWNGKKYNVTFNANGGSCYTSSTVVTYYEKYGELPTPSKTGYSFAGWYTDITGGYLITKDTTVTIDKNQVLYARWNANYFTVTFVTNGGTVAYSSKQVLLDEKYGSLPTPYRAGYTFMYWYRTSDNGTIEIVNENSIVPRDGSHYRYLYARWY